MTTVGRKSRLSASVVHSQTPIPLEPVEHNRRLRFDTHLVEMQPGANVITQRWDTAYPNGFGVNL